LWLDKGLVSPSPVLSAETLTIDLTGFLVLPGLINAHDHLELNLFPRLGRGPYPNASVWARDIYHPDRPPVKQHVEVSKSLRLWWGGIKNLISGVTTVAHHNTFAPIFADANFPVRVVKRYGWAHSIQYSLDWEARFRNTPADYPFVMHAAEGTDEAAARELQLLFEAGALNESTILVHGVALTSHDLPVLKRTKASLVWCPSSNQFTLNRTVEPDVLNSDIPIALGSDSAMTADGDLLDELRVAHRTTDAQRVYQMVTHDAARIFKLPPGFGSIQHGGPADLLIMRDIGKTPATTLLSRYPDLVIVGGQIRLVSQTAASVCPPNALRSLESLEVEGRGRYLVAANVSRLLHETIRSLHESPRVAGKAVAA
jgi:cytosine/adenosine deaminase-related metal-dependent hydrolase